MVKIIKKKRKLRMESLVTMIFMFSFLAFLFSATILKPHNVSLSKENEEMERMNSVLENDVANLEVEVKRLDNRDRILEIAKEHGLSVNQDSIVSVVGEGIE